MPITQDEFKELIQDEENKEMFHDIAKSLGYESKEDVEGLKKKNYEVLGRMRNLKGELGEHKKQLDSIDLEAYSEYVNKSSETKGSSDKLQRDYNLLKDSFSKKEESYNTLEKEYNTNKINSELSKTFDELGIDPKHKNILSSAFQGKAKIETDNGVRTVLIDNGDGLGLPTNEYFKQWTETDTGKEYLKKQENSGANSRSFAQSGSNTMKRSEFDKLPTHQQAAKVKAGLTPVD